MSAPHDDRPSGRAITALETVILPDFPNLLYVRIETDDGLVGLGETFYGAEAVAAYLHESAAPLLLGADPLRITALGRRLAPYVGYAGSGAERRGISAVDMALWDLLGKVTGQPVHQLLGGAVREDVRVYNTCAGYRYVRREPRQSSSNWGLPVEGAAQGPYEDLDAFLHRADELAESLLAEGYTAMKIWPFDRYAEASGGLHISAADLRAGLEPFERIRRAVGDRLDIMVELHGLWRLPAARRIARALEDYGPSWLEDPLRADDLPALVELAASTTTPLALSETLSGAGQVRDLLTSGAAGYVIFDVGWGGGISEARAVASLAEAFGRPVAPHDCTGPVALMACAHLAVALPAVVVQEVVRAACSTWYGELVTVLPEVADGRMAAPPGPGLGTELRPEVLAHPSTRRRRSERG